MRVLATYVYASGFLYRLMLQGEKNLHNHRLKAIAPSLFNIEGNWYLHHTNLNKTFSARAHSHVNLIVTLMDTIMLHAF